MSSKSGEKDKITVYTGLGDVRVRRSSHPVEVRKQTPRDLKKAKGGK